MQIDVIKRAIELVPEVRVYLSPQVLDMLTKRVPPKQSEKNAMERKLTALMNKRFKWEAEHIRSKLERYFADRKGWVTIDGNHVLIGEDDGYSESGGKGSYSVADGSSTIDKLSDRFGMPNIDVIDDPDMFDAIGHAGKGKDIVVNEKLLNDSNAYDEKYNTGVARNAEDIVTHEYGHRIQTELANDEKYFGLGLSRPGMYYERGIGEQAADSLGMRLGRISNQEGSIISDYATKNDNEYFAEAFVLYVRGPDNYDRINPELLHIFEVIDHGKR